MQSGLAANLFPAARGDGAAVFPFDHAPALPLLRAHAVWDAAQMLGSRARRLMPAYHHGSSWRRCSRRSDAGLLSGDAQMRATSRRARRGAGAPRCSHPLRRVSAGHAGSPAAAGELACPDEDCALALLSSEGEKPSVLRRPVRVLLTRLFRYRTEALLAGDYAKRLICCRRPRRRRSPAPLAPRRQHALDLELGPVSRPPGAPGHRDAATVRRQASVERVSTGTQHFNPRRRPGMSAASHLSCGTRTFAGIVERRSGTTSISTRCCARSPAVMVS